MTREARWFRLLDFRRLGARPPAASQPRGPLSRSDFQRDFDRIVFSTAFRRLHDKTQVFPLPENDLVHSRLTHSLEVSCVGRSLGTLVGQEVCGALPALPAQGLDARSIGDIVAAACVAHDLGNPPFGHAGEDAIGSWFRGHEEFTGDLSPAERADFEDFEGNAQGFRILTKLQIPENPGLQLTMATLAAFTKYPRTAGPRPPTGGVAVKKHGVFQSELKELETVMNAVGLDESPGEPTPGRIRAWSRHPLAFLMEAADDICYCILDIEDGFRLGYVPFSEAEALLHALLEGDPTYKRRRPVTHSEKKEAVAYLRAKSINRLAYQVKEAFMSAETELLEGQLFVALSKRIPSAEALDAIIGYTRETCYQARDVLEIELAGYEVLSALLDVFIPAVLSPNPNTRERKLIELLPEPLTDSATPYERMQRVTDHLSGMTDRYAIATYRKLRGISLTRG